MSKLSLCEIKQSQLDKTLIIDGQLIVCLDTGNIYRDSTTARVKIGSDLEVVSELPLAPLGDRIYLLKPNCLYTYINGDWILLNKSSSAISVQDNLVSDSTTDALSAAQGKTLKEMIDKKVDPMSLVALVVPATGWNTDNSVSYPYYIDIPVQGLSESDCVAVVISPSDADIAEKSCFTTTETKENILRLRARFVPKRQIGAFYYIVREDIVMAFGPVSIGGSPYTLPPATKEVLGGVIIGDGLVVDEDGKASVTTDTTLEVIGVPADAKTVGDSLANKAALDHTHNYAASSSAGGTALSVNGFNFTATDTDSGADTELETGTILVVYE